MDAISRWGVRAFLAVTLLAIVASITLAPRSATAVAHRCSSGVFCQDPAGWQWIYDVSTHGFIRSQVSRQTTGSGAVFDYSYESACAGGNADDAELCGRAVTACAGDGAGAILYSVWVQQVAPTLGPRNSDGTVCFGGPADTVTVAQLGVDLNEDVRDHLPTLSARAQPSPQAVVNLPVIVSAPVEPAPNFNVNQPVPGVVTVTSTYRWTFDDGATLIGTGRAYDGTDPRTAPGGYYLAHTYTHADAHASATLTVTWHATFTVAGGPPIALPDIVTPPQTVAFQVHEVRSVLVSGS
jgi:hypothetical protein